MLTNDVVSFEQPGPGIFIFTSILNGDKLPFNSKPLLEEFHHPEKWTEGHELFPFWKKCRESPFTIMVSQKNRAICIS